MKRKNFVIDLQLFAKKKKEDEVEDEILEDEEEEEEIEDAKPKQKTNSTEKMIKELYKKLCQEEIETPKKPQTVPIPDKPIIPKEEQEEIKEKENPIKKMLKAIW